MLLWQRVLERIGILFYFPYVIVQSSAAIVTTLLATVFCPTHGFDTPKKNYAASF